MESFERSDLWKNNLAHRPDDDRYAESRRILRDSFLQTRKSVEPLVRLIASELPDLTVHDITHIDSLWDIADTLMGNEYHVNPAETFVLGLAFLLHDAACSTFAYPKGIDSLMETSEWRDIVALNQFSESSMSKGEKGYQFTLFETLRLLHPKQAETLLTQNWPDLEGQNRYLMENVELRNYYGRDVGLIAASHGRDAALAEQRWGNANKLTPHSCLNLDNNEDWTVDCLKIAMLLRCIDAAHINSKRAPDILASLLQPTTQSRTHWVFQNRLGNCSINSQKEIYWTSGKNFEESDSDAWWLCYDTMKMIDREIKTANRILKTNGRQELHVKGVAGANDISTFLKNVQVQGWRPIDINFKIQDVGGVIEKFGGEKLYGNNPHLALRELIQNAADAIRARRLHRALPDLGRIEISLVETDGEWWLHIQDNGVGMSTYVLSEVLLDFGRSLWRDSNVREEWTGLAGKGFEAVGQFGVGFFSVFMLGNEIKVTSWRDGDSEDNQQTLHLRNVTKSKPILLNTPQGKRLKEFGTLVSIHLKKGRSTLLPQIPENDNEFFSPTRITKEMTLSQVVGVLAPALDIDVWCTDGKEEKVKVITANDWRSLSPIELMQRIAPVYNAERLARYVEHFTDICQEGDIVGRASLAGSAIGGFGFDLGVLVHKGLNMGRWNKCGILLSHNNEDLARSSATPVCSKDALMYWAESIQNIMIQKIMPYITQSLLSLGLLPDKLPLTEIGGKYLTGEEFSAFIASKEFEEVLFLVETPSCPDSMSSDDFHDQFAIDNNVIDISLIHSAREDFGLKGWIHNLIPETDSDPRSIGSALHGYVRQAWSDVDVVKEKRVIGRAGSEEVTAHCIVYRAKK